VTLDNNNGTDGQTDRRRDRVRRNMRPPPREEGRIITRKVISLGPISWNRSNIFRTRKSAVAYKSARRVRRSGKVTKHSTIPYAGFSYCAIVTMSLRNHDSRLPKKCRDLEMGSKVTHSHSEWCHSVDGVWFPVSVQ